MDYQFLIDTYETERIKVLSTWSTFKDEDLSARPHPNDKRGRNALEQMIHQCMGENKWFTGMLGVDVGAPPLPENETRLEFIKRYAEDSGKRVEALKEKDDDWWAEEVKFFEFNKSRAWIVTRRIAHTAHHRGQQTMLLRMLGREITAHTAQLQIQVDYNQNGALTIYPYSDIDTLIKEEAGWWNCKGLITGARRKTVHGTA